MEFNDMLQQHKHMADPNSSSDRERWGWVLLAVTQMPISSYVSLCICLYCMSTWPLISSLSASPNVALGWMLYHTQWRRNNWHGRRVFKWAYPAGCLQRFEKYDNHTAWNIHLFKCEDSVDNCFPRTVILQQWASFLCILVSFHILGNRLKFKHMIAWYSSEWCTACPEDKTLICVSLIFKARTARIHFLPKTANR